MTPEVKELMRKLSVLLARASTIRPGRGILHQVQSSGNTVVYNTNITPGMVEEYLNELYHRDNPPLEYLTMNDTPTVVDGSSPFS